MRIGQILREVRLEKGCRQNNIVMMLRVGNIIISRSKTGKEALKDTGMLAAWVDKLVKLVFHMKILTNFMNNYYSITNNITV